MGKFLKTDNRQVLEGIYDDYGSASTRAVDDQAGSPGGSGCRKKPEGVSGQTRSILRQLVRAKARSLGLYQFALRALAVDSALCIDPRIPYDHETRTRMSWFLHIDMDAFYASVEEALDPSLKGKPVIVGGRNGRGVVTSASYAARKFGVRSAMPGFQAKKLCPQGIFLPNRRRTYVEFSDKVFAILEQYSPEVHALSIDEGLVDLTGTDRLFGPPLKTADAIIRRIENEFGLALLRRAFDQQSRRQNRRDLGQAAWAGLRSRRRGNRFSRAVGSGDDPRRRPQDPQELLQRGIKTIGDLLARPELAARYLGSQRRCSTPPLATITPSAMKRLWIQPAQDHRADGKSALGAGRRSRRPAAPRRVFSPAA